MLSQTFTFCVLLLFRYLLLSEQYKDSDIHLYGTQTYGEGLKETIENSLITKYSNNNIKVYVN